jgi:hypothetical protein
VTATGTDLAPNLLINVNSSTSQTELILTNATIASGDQITVQAGEKNAVLGAVGTVINTGLVSFAQSGASNAFLAVQDQPGGGASTFINNGMIDLSNSISVLTATPSTPGTQANANDQISNNGIIALLPSTGSELGFVNLLSVTGNGSLRVGAGYRLEFNRAVGSGQTVFFEPRTTGSGASVLQLDNPGTFAATVAGFTASDSIQMTSLPFTSESLVNNNGVTTLTFSSNGSTVASINLRGTYTTNNVSFSTSGVVNGAVVTTINTSVPDSTTAPTSVYRWFDTLFGTHFFTSDPGERATVNATRPDLKAEPNDFGTVNPAANDPNSEVVYRFFDNVHGTHFFTASESEKNTILGTRPDLIFEPSSSFLEHAVQLPGDVPVYRFFDSNFGTHFYTGDVNERSTILASRPDLVPEGIGFYAPGQIVPV